MWSCITKKPPRSPARYQHVSSHSGGRFDVPAASHAAPASRTRARHSCSRYLFRNPLPERPISPWALSRTYFHPRSRVEHGAEGRATFVSPFAALPSMLRCPDCNATLELSGRSLICPKGHSFDLAREGYANLSRSRRTGDSKEMLHARRRFLEAGHYEPLSDLVNRSGGRTPFRGFVYGGGCRLRRGLLPRPTFRVPDRPGQYRESTDGIVRRDLAGNRWRQGSGGRTCPLLVLVLPGLSGDRTGCGKGRRPDGGGPLSTRRVPGGGHCRTPPRRRSGG